MMIKIKKDKLINNQARLKKDAVVAGDGGNRWHSGTVEKRQGDKERKERQMRGRDIK